MTEAVREAQDLALALDKTVFLLGEDIGDPPGGVFKTSAGLQTKYGARVRPTPIAEQAIVGAAIGASLVGMRPVAEIMFNDFAGVCIDQIYNHAAKQRYMSGGKTHVPLTIRMMVGGGIGGFGAQHSQSLEAWLLHTPGLKVVYPSTAFDAKGLLLSCIFDEDPCIQLESIKLLFSARDEVPTGDYRVPLGVAKMRREGADISLISYGWQMPECLAAAETVAKGGHLRRGDRSADPASARLPAGARLREENPPRAHRPRRRGVLRLRCRDREHHHRGAVFGPQGTRGETRRRLRPDCLFPRDRDESNSERELDSRPCARCDRLSRTARTI